MKVLPLILFWMVLNFPILKQENIKDYSNVETEAILDTPLEVSPRCLKDVEKGLSRTHSIHLFNGIKISTIKVQRATMCCRVLVWSWCWLFDVLTKMERKVIVSHCIYRKPYTRRNSYVADVCSYLCGHHTLPPTMVVQPSNYMFFSSTPFPLKRFSIFSSHKPVFVSKSSSGISCYFLVKPASSRNNTWVCNKMLFLIMMCELYLRSITNQLKDKQYVYIPVSRLCKLSDGNITPPLPRCGITHIFKITISSVAY